MIINLKPMFRGAAWLVLVAVVFMTLGSPRYRPTTTLNHDIEHALAFILLGGLFALGYTSRRLAILVAAVPLIGILEALQLLVPGRHARLEDFAVNVGTFWVAFVAASVALAFVVSPLPTRDDTEPA